MWVKGMDSRLRGNDGREGCRGMAGGEWRAGLSAGMSAGGGLFWRFSAALRLLYHAKARRVVALVAQGDVGLQVLGCKPLGKLAVQHDLGFAAGGVQDFAVAPCHGHAYA